MRKLMAPRSLLLLFLGCVTAFGCIVPSVFHDSWTQVEDNRDDGLFVFIIVQWEVPYTRNRLTGDIQRGPAPW